MKRFGCCTVVAVITMLCWSSWVEALDRENLPLSLTKRAADSRSVPVVAYPGINLDEVMREDAKRSDGGMAPRFAVPMKTSLTPSTSGQLERLEGGVILWRLRVTSHEALSLNFGFTRFHLPPTAALWIYSTDYSQIIGAFSDEDNSRHRQLWTPVVLGDEAVIELAVEERFWPFLELELGSVNHGYTGFGYGSFTKSGSCNLDVICGTSDGYPQVEEWRDEIRSVAVIATGGSTFCTGFLVNNVEQDLTPYFMTAFHCSITSDNAPSLVAYWNFDNSFCREPDSAASGGAGDGSLTTFNSGSTFRAASSTSDFTIVEFDTSPPPGSNAHWAGWDATSGDFPSAVGIHHPRTDEKRICFEDQPTSTTSYLDSAVPGDGSHVRIEDWDLGTTEPGSSGSPVFNQVGHVIGQLHGGYAACGNNDSDWYGRISVSWEGRGSAPTRLKDWLDPNASGTMVIDGRDECTPPTFDFTLTPNPALAGEEVVFEVTVTVGVGPYDTAWDFDDDGTVDCLTNPCSFSYSTFYNGDVVLEVTDQGADCSGRVRHAMAVSGPKVQFVSATAPVEVCGDGDATIEAGESWKVAVTVENVGDLDATETSAEIILQAGSDNVSLLRGGLSFATVPAGNQATDYFSFLVEAGFTPCGASIHFDLDTISWDGVSHPGVRNAFTAVTGGGNNHQTMFFDDFEDAGTWSGLGDPLAVTSAWVVTTGPGPHTDGEWGLAASGSQGQPSGSSGTFAVADSDGAGESSFTSSIAYSPLVDLSSVLVGAVTLEAEVLYRYYSSGGEETGSIDVWDGVVWQTVAAFNTSDLDERVSIDVTAHALGNPDFRIRFSYQGASFDWFFAIDDVSITVLLPPVCDNSQDCGVPGPRLPHRVRNG